MKIAQIAPPWIRIPPTTYGGTELIISFLIEELVTGGHDITLFAPEDAKTSARLVSFYPQALTSQDVPWEAHLKAYYHLFKSLEHSAEFDVVHTHLSSPGDMYIFPLMSQLDNVHVTTLHSNFPFDKIGAWTGDADDFFLEWIRPTPIVTVSQSALANLPYDLNVAGVVHLGLPMQHYPLPGNEPEAFFVWLGRFVPEKGAHLAIEAAKRANVPIVLAGKVDCNIKEAVAYFRQQIQPLIDNSQVRYIGPVNMEMKQKLLSSARGLLYPITWEEPGATVVLEAMALGCPVIGYARGVLPELVVHASTGFLADGLDQIVYYISQIGSLDRSRVRSHVERNFSARIMTMKYLDIYSKLLKNRPRKR
jgi:glycosyltransferase involved in cell wall biosynthesis